MPVVVALGPRGWDVVGRTGVLLVAPRTDSQRQAQRAEKLEHLDDVLHRADARALGELGHVELRLTHGTTPHSNSDTGSSGLILRKQEGWPGPRRSIAET